MVPLLPAPEKVRAVNLDTARPAAVETVHGAEAETRPLGVRRQGVSTADDREGFDPNQIPGGFHERCRRRRSSGAEKDPGSLGDRGELLGMSGVGRLSSYGPRGRRQNLR